MIVILMGVSGTGKSTVGRALAAQTGWQFADADDFHSEANKAKMRSGIPLTDADRAPWLRDLHAQIEKWIDSGATAILACSALKESYRIALVADTPPNSVRFVYLTGPEELIRKRIETRTGHYMPASLLASQIATLEPPSDAIEISVAQTIPAMVAEIRNALAREGYSGTAGQTARGGK